MINANDYRIGNLVFYFDGYYLICSIKHCGYYDSKPIYRLELDNVPLSLLDLDEVEPIPITDEILNKLKVDKEWGINIYSGFAGNGSFDGQIFIKKADIGVIIDICPSDPHYKGFALKPMKYLHEFQNTYYALTGEELPISDLLPDKAE